MKHCLKLYLYLCFDKKNLRLVGNMLVDHLTLTRNQFNLGGSPNV